MYRPYQSGIALYQMEKKKNVPVSLLFLGNQHWLKRLWPIGITKKSIELLERSVKEVEYDKITTNKDGKIILNS